MKKAKNNNWNCHFSTHLLGDGLSDTQIVTRVLAVDISAQWH